MAPKKAEPEPEPEAEPEVAEPETGSGAFFFPDGSKYGALTRPAVRTDAALPASGTHSCTEGEWLIKDGVKMRHGTGMFVDGMAEGQTYEGEWKDDAMSGRGVFRYASSACGMRAIIVDFLTAAH